MKLAPVFWLFSDQNTPIGTLLIPWWINITIDEVKFVMISNSKIQNSTSMQLTNIHYEQFI